MRETLADFVSRMMAEKRISGADIERVSGRRISASQVNRIRSNRLELIGQHLPDSLQLFLRDVPLAPVDHPRSLFAHDTLDISLLLIG